MRVIYEGTGVGMTRSIKYAFNTEPMAEYHFVRGRETEVLDEHAEKLLELKGFGKKAEPQEKKELKPPVKRPAIAREKDNG